MEIYDISVTVTPQIPVWPGDPSVILERVEKIEDGGNANVSRIDMGVHTGTHVDAPVHFVPGAPAVENLPLDILIGPVQVVQVPGQAKAIGIPEIAAAGIHPGTRRVLFKTTNSSYWSRMEDGFQSSFVAITKEGAEKLVEMGVQLVGIDYLSIAPFKQSRPTHQVLLKAGIVIIEGVDLREVFPGEYTLYCLPLKLGGSDGAPCRAVLVC